MKFSSSRDASDRAGGGISRMTLVTADDTHFMQEVEAQGFTGEQQQGIEHVHPYGFTAVANDQIQGSPQAAEGFAGFLSGNRSHAIIFVMGDRRYRLMNLGKGDVALHRDDGQQVHFASDGTYVSAPNGKKITLQIMQSSSMPVATPQPKDASATMGQGPQKGQAAHASIVMDTNGITVTHPGAVTWNVGALTINAGSTINMTSTGAFAINGNKVDINS